MQEAKKKLYPFYFFASLRQFTLLASAFIAYPARVSRSSRTR